MVRAQHCRKQLLVWRSKSEKQLIESGRLCWKRQRNILRGWPPRAEPKCFLSWKTCRRLAHSSFAEPATRFFLSRLNKLPEESSLLPMAIMDWELPQLPKQPELPPRSMFPITFRLPRHAGLRRSEERHVG